MGVAAGWYNGLHQGPVGFGEPWCGGKGEQACVTSHLEPEGELGPRHGHTGLAPGT